LAATATGTAAALSLLAPVRGFVGIAAGGTQLDGVLGVLMRHLAKTPGLRLVVIGKENRALAADPEFRVVAITRERRVLVPAVEQRTVVVSAEKPEPCRMTTFIKDPDAVLDYSVDWSKWLAGDQIATSAWSVSDPALEAGVDSNTPTRTTVWLSGGVACQAYTVTNRITTSGGRTDERSFVIQVQDR
jgi:hypothetical protein